MAKATFIVPIQNSSPVLPPMDAGPGEVQLHFTEGGLLKGGFSCVGEVPNTSSAIVLIDSSQVTIDWMTANNILLEVLEDAKA